MTITINSVDELSTKEVNAAHELMVRLVQEQNPSVDTKRGVIHDLVLHLSAVTHAATMRAIDVARRSSSLLEVQADPSIADEGVLDSILANHGITRQDGKASRGPLLIELSAEIATTIPAGTEFRSDGGTFRTERAFSARLSAENVSRVGDRVLQQIGDRTWAFTVDVVATEEGRDGLRRGDRVIPVSPPRNYLRASAAEDFEEGRTKESNAQLLERFSEGIASSSWSNRPAIRALVRRQEAFKDVIDMSIIGMGDAEMLRDQRGILPVSIGGRCDLYVKTASLPLRKTFDVDFTYIGTRDGEEVWQAQVGRDLMAGAYDALAGSFPDGRKLNVTNVTRILAAGDDAPDVISAEEAAFSPYQSLSVELTPTLPSTEELVANTTIITGQIVVRGMPLVGEIQSFVSSREVKSPGTDVLVRACVPCDMSAAVRIVTRPGDEEPDLQQIRSAMAAYVNGTGLRGQIEASSLTDIVHDHLHGRSAVSGISLQGRILSPIGGSKFVRGSELIAIPEAPGEYTTRRTCAFFLDPQDIEIAVEAVGD